MIASAAAHFLATDELTPLPAERLAQDLKELGFAALGTVHHNLTSAALVEQAVVRDEAMMTADGALLAYTGRHTDLLTDGKFIVRDSGTETTVDWGKINRSMTPAAFDALFERMQHWAEGREIFVQDVLVGADAAHDLSLRVVTQLAWHNLFARTMFIHPAEETLAPGFTVVDFPDFEVVPERDQTVGKAFVIINLTRRLVLIGGTAYAGEIKKAVFTVMNSLLPERGVLPMRAAANSGADGDVALFIGSSGAGKTALSADGTRTLIGDDEHGWSERGVFNFEAGCSAKAARLNPQQEPEIYAATCRFGAILENAIIDPDSRDVDFANTRFTENIRASYPIDFIGNASPLRKGGMPKHIIILTCDAFGVLPPLSRLTPGQAIYHFLSGYTARVAGAEHGANGGPVAEFSACFGESFLSRSAGVYARMLGERIAQHSVRCWLVNTGWTGGYDGGERMPIDVTRKLVRAVLSGALDQAAFVEDGVFGLQVPTAVAGVPDNLLLPQCAWKDDAAYRETARQLAELFAKNFAQFADQVSDEVRQSALRGV